MEIILTADRTLMSNYRHNEFVGFGSTAPPNLVPEWFYRLLFFPPIKIRNGIPSEAPYGLRKIESQLINEGFNVLTVDPDHLEPYINKAKVLGIHVMDPFGWGPASSTFTRILNTGESYLVKYFRILLERPEVKEAKKKGLKIIVGGPGAWEFKYRPNIIDKYGIDCVVDGEAEKVAGEIFGKALKGEKLPKFYDVDIKDTPSIQEIPEIKNPSINGLVEIGRGCCRGCKFYSTTLRPLRWYPYEKIEKEIKVNVNADIRTGVLFAEDVMLYGSRNVMPNRKKVLGLHELCVEYWSSLGWSHCSMAAVAADPQLLERVAEMILAKQDWWGAEIGIETGSPELVRKFMPGKALPFKPEDWPEVVKTAAGVMTDNNLIPACTLITGLPGERDEDVIRTIELIENLKDFKSLIVPLFFVPLGQLTNENWFTMEEMTELQKELLIKCLNHDLKWTKYIMRFYFRQWYGSLISLLYRFFVWLVERKAKEVTQLMPEATMREEKEKSFAQISIRR